MDRTGRVGDFQWRFLSGSFSARTDWTSGKSPEGSVYSTGNSEVRSEQRVAQVLRAGNGAYLPVTLLEPPCGDGSMVSVALFGRR